MSNRSLHAIVLSAAGLAGAAQAQSVNVYGIVDTYVGTVNGGQGSVRQVAEGGWAASRLGFAGNEDLGGGWSAHFDIEMGLTMNTGAIPIGGGFGRQSFAGLTDSQWGSINLGRQYTTLFQSLQPLSTFRMNGNWDPIQLIVKGDGQGAAYAALPAPQRQNNLLRYTYGDYRQPGLTVDVVASPGQGAVGSERSNGAGIGYGGQGFQVSASTQNTYSAVLASRSYARSIGGAGQFGPVRLSALYILTGATASGSHDAKHMGLGISYATGLHNWLAQVALRKVDVTNHDSTATTLGYEYSLSKKTGLYARAMFVSNRGGAANAMALAVVVPNGEVRAYAIGVKQNF